MPQNLSPASPLGPFNIGNIVSVGLRLYRSHFKNYFGIAFIATLWSMLPFVLFLVAVGILITNNAGPWSYVLIVLISLGLVVYCGAKALMNTALISRLAFGELSQKPESVHAARQLLNNRMWGIFGVQILTALIMFAASFTLSIIQMIVFGGISALLSDIIVLSVIITLVGNLVYLVVYFWIYTHFFVPEVPIAVEENVAAVASIGRCWDLSKNSVVRILGVMSVACLITLPLYALAMTPMISGLFAIAPLLNNPNAVIFGAPNALQQFAIAFLIGILLSFVVNLFVMPFWQATKAVLYYDLRSRREGLDLRLRDRNS